MPVPPSSALTGPVTLLLPAKLPKCSADVHGVWAGTEASLEAGYEPIHQPRAIALRRGQASHERFNLLHQGNVTNSAAIGLLSGLISGLILCALRSVSFMVSPTYSPTFFASFYDTG